MLDRDMRRSQGYVASNHFKSGVTKYLLEREDIAAVDQVARGEGMAAEVRVKAFHAGLLGYSPKHHSQCVICQMSAVQGEE